MVQQSNIVTIDDETVRQRIDKAHGDLWIGRNTATDDPVTIPRTGNSAPIIITATTRRGRTTLCQHIAPQRMIAGQGVTYVGDDQAITDLLQLAPDERTDDITCISPATSTTAGETAVQQAFDETGPPICAIPTSRTSTDHNTTLTGTHLTAVEQYVSHYPREHRTQPYTIILDGLARLEADALDLDLLAEHSRTIPVQLVVALQSLDHLPSLVASQLYQTAETLLTGTLSVRDTDPLANHYTNVTPDDLLHLPRYQWWVRHTTDEGVTETPLTSPPPHPPRREITLDDYCEV